MDRQRKEDFKGQGRMKNKWTIFTKRNGPRVECWYAWGLAFEIELSCDFRGVYFKIGCVEVHLGFWSKEYLDNMGWWLR
jgi:hypothetical protein